jgi:hypothetical protein
MIKNGKLKEGDKVTVCFADSSGNMVWSYPAIYQNGWFDHQNPTGNNRHDTPESIGGTWSWYVSKEESTQGMEQ